MQESDRAIQAMNNAQTETLVAALKRKLERNAFLAQLRDKGHSGKAYSDAVVQYDRQFLN